MRKTILVALLGATLLYAEFSAFDAGSFTDDSSRGLTQNEGSFKDRTHQLSDDYTQIKARLNEMDQRIEGLQSTLEGINSQYSRSNSRLSQLEEESAENNLSQEIQNLKAYVEESRKIQEANYNQIKKVLAELSSIVDSISSNHIPKNELKSSDLNKTTPTEKNDSNNTSQEGKKKIKEEISSEAWKKKKNEEILDLGIGDLNKNALEEATAKFDHLAKNQYKLAKVNFYLGEVQYKQKNYNNAISYYKKSSAASTKGDYYPKLLYHTAISLDKIGDTENANGFYKALKASYPDSPEAKASPNRK